MLLGAENIHGIRGIFLDGCVMDEYADMPESMFPEVIRPALSDRKGYGIVIGTPRGMSAFYELYEAAQSDKYWYVKTYKASETKILDEEELESGSRQCRPISTTRNLSVAGPLMSLARYTGKN